MAENAVISNHLNHDTLSDAIELCVEEMIEVKSKYEIQEHWSNRDALRVMNQHDSQSEVGNSSYKSPALSIPKIPPEQS
jgi:hypothetical protein